MAYTAMIAVTTIAVFSGHARMRTPTMRASTPPTPMATWMPFAAVEGRAAAVVIAQVLSGAMSRRLVGASACRVGCHHAAVEGEVHPLPHPPRHHRGHRALGVSGRNC